MHKHHDHNQPAWGEIKSRDRTSPIYQQSEDENEEQTTPYSQIASSALSSSSEQCHASSTRATPGTPSAPEQAAYELAKNLSRSPLQLPNSHLERELSDIPERMEGRALGEDDLLFSPARSNSRSPLLARLQEARMQNSAEQTGSKDDR
eukprot:CAMPEP_0185269760 /NCGR_PEP_ID=MMETSP1359-20130426/40709_1 /TAXON_ID=552665 /ORGANISM="Bigelowiella longifila, Strain CCMP242" /LENGTH=148 /DNA_ID=CAMNT_0027861073 /DNA_START=366 /DNA_END=812 /DNA_ORIENTATION=-